MSLSKKEIIALYPRIVKHPVLETGKVFKSGEDFFITDALDNQGNSPGLGFLWIRRHNAKKPKAVKIDGVYEEEFYNPHTTEVVGAINVVSYEKYTCNVDTFKERLSDPMHLAVLADYYYPTKSIWEKLVDFFKGKK